MGRGGTDQREPVVSFEHSGTPLPAGTIGWRCWRYLDGGVASPRFASRGTDARWPADRAVGGPSFAGALCGSSCPNGDCPCGVYACVRPADALAFGMANLGRSDVVLGTVHLFGGVWTRGVYESGVIQIKGAYARIGTLYVPDEHLSVRAPLLAERYDVPVLALTRYPSAPEQGAS